MRLLCIHHEPTSDGGTLLAPARAGGSIVGGVLAALGAGIVAVLMLRAMAEWRVTHPDA